MVSISELEPLEIDELVDEVVDVIDSLGERGSELRQKIRSWLIAHDPDIDFSRGAAYDLTLNGIARSVLGERKYAESYPFSVGNRKAMLRDIYEGIGLEVAERGDRWVIARWDGGEIDEALLSAIERNARILGIGYKINVIGEKKVEVVFIGDFSAEDDDGGTGELTVREVLLELLDKNEDLDDSVFGVLDGELLDVLHVNQEGGILFGDAEDIANFDEDVVELDHSEEGLVSVRGLILGLVDMAESADDEAFGYFKGIPLCVTEVNDLGQLVLVEEDGLEAETLPVAEESHNAEGLYVYDYGNQLRAQLAAGASIGLLTLGLLTTFLKNR